ncbi:mitochondrial ATP synthase g subunit-domain-containing protein [Coniella lustricola]|uniref:Mitochondrial ATP synthase g subunit-domain-containing protein n=1 Tax=Coniella lustricola TaxID=2025994 RepID=A0A2T2ZTF7_9PEZI|nr:mitochondrial ATP synthase g subunit-domain-containing protein [Coniella lustricola]
MRRPLVPLRNVVARRFESSSASSTAQKATEGAKNAAGDYKNKAAEGLSRVSSAAGPAISNAAQGVSNALGRVGGRTGKVISFVERQVPFVVYYSKVGLELGRLVFKGQKMDPPSISTFQSYFNRIVSALKNPGSLLQSTASTAANSPSVIARVQNISRAQVVGTGVLLAEVLGFFTIGEMLGRLKLVGYHGEQEHHH